MKDLKDALKAKDFVIKPIVFTSVDKFKLNINEFLLIIYFINVKQELDLEDIKRYFKIEESNILNAFNSLLEKKLIETKVNKTKNGIEEKISLDIFYDKLLLEDNKDNKYNKDNKDNKDNKESDIYSVFENEYGRTLSNTEYETITAWLEKGYNEEDIIKVLKESVLNGITNLRYIDKVLFENNKKDNKEYKPLFDYNWLDENE